MVCLTSLRIKNPPMLPKLNRRRVMFVLTKIDQILAWEQQKDTERDTRFVDLGRYLCEVRAGQYWRVENLKSFDEFGLSLCEPRVPAMSLAQWPEPRGLQVRPADLLKSDWTAQLPRRKPTQKSSWLTRQCAIEVAAVTFHLFPFPQKWDVLHSHVQGLIAAAQRRAWLPMLVFLFSRVPKHKRGKASSTTPWRRKGTLKCISGQTNHAY